MKTSIHDQQFPELSDKQWSFAIPEEIDRLQDTEKMKLIRSRKRQNQDKVRKFFGSDLKIDVSLSMIKKYRLPAMMESDLPLTYFISFLIKYQGVENLVRNQADNLSIVYNTYLYDLYISLHISTYLYISLLFSISP